MPAGLTSVGVSNGDCNTNCKGSNSGEKCGSGSSDFTCYSGTKALSFYLCLIYLSLSETLKLFCLKGPFTTTITSTSTSKF